MENEQVLEVVYTTQELINLSQSRILELKGYLADTDYLHNKDGAGEDMSEYPEWRQKRISARKSINDEQVEIARLRSILAKEQEEEFSTGET